MPSLPVNPKDKKPEEPVEVPPPQNLGLRSRPISRTLMRLRETNARVLGISEEQLRAEKENELTEDIKNDDEC